MRRLLLAILALWATTTATAQAGQDDLQPRSCPAVVADAATCYGGRDANGSFLLAAIPKQWNQKLVVHAHGGPRMEPPQANDSDEDLERFGAMVRAGYAWIGPTYRREGYAVRRAAADIDSARAVFWRQFGKPSATILHGQSWGAQIALKTLELYGQSPTGETFYDAALLTNGVVAGGARAYQFRVDLRAIYQFYCRNHPRPDEPQYPVWMGLPQGASMTRDALEERLRECTGVGMDVSRRTPEQQHRLANILAASGVKERQLRQHLSWATNTMRTLIDTIGGGNPFDNRATVYSGTSDDAALNAGIARFGPDAVALARLDFESKPTGQVIAPVLSLFSRGDPQVSPALQADLKSTFEASGRQSLLAQVDLDWSDHSRLPDDALIAALTALDAWRAGGPRPDKASVLAACARDARDCRALM